MGGDLTDTDAYNTDDPLNGDKHLQRPRNRKNSARDQFYKAFLSVIYEFSYKARAFVLGKPFQPSQMFSDKAGAYPSEAPLHSTLVTLGGEARSLP